MNLTNESNIKIVWYTGSDLQSAIATSAAEGSILFVPTGTNGGSLYANGRQFGLDEESIKELVYTVTTTNIEQSQNTIAALIEAIDTKLGSLSGTIGNLSGTINTLQLQSEGTNVTGSTYIDVTTSGAAGSGLTYIISANGLATSDYASSISGTVNNLSGTVVNLSGTVSNLSGAVNALTSTSSATLEALHAIEAELTGPNANGTIETFLDTVYAITDGFLPTGDNETGTSIKEYIDSLSGTVNGLTDQDTQTYVTGGSDIIVSGSLVEGQSGTFTIALETGTKTTITNASSNASTAIDALTGLTGSGAVKDYIDTVSGTANTINGTVTNINNKIGTINSQGPTGSELTTIGEQLNDLYTKVSGANASASNAVLKWTIVS